MLNLTTAMSEHTITTLEHECGEKILQNLDRQLKQSQLKHEKINRLLSMRHFVSTQVLDRSN